MLSAASRCALMGGGIGSVGGGSGIGSGGGDGGGVGSGSGGCGIGITVFDSNTQFSSPKVGRRAGAFPPQSLKPPSNEHAA